MKHFIRINQGAIIEAGLHQSTDFIDWVILEYVHENKHLNYLKLIEELPITGLKSKSVVSGRLSKLYKLGLVDKKLYSDAEAYEKLYSGCEYGCVFCGTTNSVLDNHHYPIRAKDKGTETIALCVACHRLFHLMTDKGIYEISPIVKKIITEGSV
jgi:DNA-binding transcriptional ArsR family regulator